MGFFFKDKPIDCYKKVNKLIEKMYYIKKSLIISAERSNDCDRHDICSRIDDIIDCYNSIVRMDFKGQYALMRSNVWLGSSVVDYECERLSIEDFMSKVFKEIEVIKRIAKGAPIVRHYKIFCVNGNTGFRNESRIFYFIHLQKEEYYERKESSSA